MYFAAHTDVTGCITIQCTGVAVRAESEFSVAGGNPVIVVVMHPTTRER